MFEVGAESGKPADVVVELFTSYFGGGTCLARAQIYQVG